MPLLSVIIPIYNEEGNIKILYEKFVFHTSQLPGWASIMVTILFIGSIQLLSLGIIGEYISRIANDVRGRPLYIVKDHSLPSE